MSISNGFVGAVLSAAWFVLLASPVRADIFEWEYVHPDDPSQGKKASTTLVPDGAGVAAVPGAHLANRNLTKAHLLGAQLTSLAFYDESHWPVSDQATDLSNSQLVEADLSGANLSGGWDISWAGDWFYLSGANLTNANLSQATLRGANFLGATLTGANFSGADIAQATIPGLTLSQLYSTASYQQNGLAGVNFGNSAWPPGAHFAQKDLTSAGSISRRCLKPTSNKRNSRKPNSRMPALKARIFAAQMRSMQTLPQPI